MFRSRKRKVSPDKKPEKSKKLKDGSKVFRSPSSPKATSDAKDKLSKLLPEGYNSIILTANTKPEENFEDNEAVFGCVRLPILSKEEAMVWVRKFERKTYTSYRTQKTWKKDVKTGLFKRRYICKIATKDSSGQATASICRGSIIFTIKDQKEIRANPDYYLRDYPSQVIIHFCHNHKIEPENLRDLRPSPGLRVIFGTYFAKGHSPFSALICHKCDLHSSYGPEFYNVVSNGRICPSYNWCFHEYEKFFLRKFVEPSEEKLKEKLKDTVSQYNAKWRTECAIISCNPLLVVSICTPLMKSIFRSGFAEEFITVRCFSTPKIVPKQQKLILFLCHTPIGSLPFGVVVTDAEDTENVCAGIRDLIKMLGVESYHPKTIIIDENALVSKALKKCFPNTQVLFNEFQMLQSVWRIIRVVCSDDDEEFQALYNLFSVTLNSSSEEDFKKNFDSLLIYAEKYPKLTNFLKYFKMRSNSYVLYARPNIDFNTDVLNYTDSGTVILQDVSIKYGSFFNIVQLFDFLSKNYVDHYERKLNKIVEGDLKGFFKTNFYVPLSKIADFTCKKINDTEFLVSLNEMKFFVNAELDTCTCQVGVHGGSCVHQFIVEKNLGLVPECYTPLCEDMLGIFKNILIEKSIKPPAPESDHLSEHVSPLNYLKSDLDTFDPDQDEFSDIVSNLTELAPDMDHLIPIDEIFLVPPDINDSFTDITGELMSPLVLSEFGDANEENEDFLNDSEQYNRESGELETITESSVQDSNDFQHNALVEAHPANLEQSVPTTDIFSNRDSMSNVIICEYGEDYIRCHNEVEIMEHRETGNKETWRNIPEESVVSRTDVEDYNITENTSSNIGSLEDHTYPIEQVEFIEDVMTENDKKTAEIAEFLTNLPDTNNSTSTSVKQLPYSQDADSIGHLEDENNVGTTENTSTIPSPTYDNSEINKYVPDKGEFITQDIQTLSSGVVVVRNEEFFTTYEVLENNVLSAVNEEEVALSKNIKDNIDDQTQYDPTPQAAHNLITDSFEENNLIMMSPNDLFDDNQNVEPDLSSDNQDLKIKILSSVVIKPPTDPPIYAPNFPLNLDAIKLKTLRNIREDSRIRMGEQRISQPSNTVFVHNPLKPEPRKIVLPIITKKNVSVNKADLCGIEDGEFDKAELTCEKDVIELYCTQSGGKILPEDKERKENTRETNNGVSQIEEERLIERNNLLQLHTQKLTPKKHIQSENNSQELGKKNPKNSEICAQEKGSDKLMLVECNLEDDSEELEQDILDSKLDSQKNKNYSDSEDITLADCDPEELAKNDFIEIIEIDSDGLEELATQEYDTDFISLDSTFEFKSLQKIPSKRSPLKIKELKDMPSHMLPFKTYSRKTSPSSSNVVPLRDFMSKSSSKATSQQKLEKSYINKRIAKDESPVCFKLNKNELLEKQLKTTFSELQKLMGPSTFKEFVEKFLKDDNEHESVLEKTKQDQAVVMFDKIKSLGNTITLTPADNWPLKQSTEKIKSTNEKLDNNKLESGKESVTKFTDTHLLRQKDCDNLLVSTTNNAYNVQNSKTLNTFFGRKTTQGTKKEIARLVDDDHHLERDTKAASYFPSTKPRNVNRKKIRCRKIPSGQGHGGKSDLSDLQYFADTSRFSFSGNDQLLSDDERSGELTNYQYTESAEWIKSKEKPKILKKAGEYTSKKAHSSDNNSDKSVDHVRRPRKTNKEDPKAKPPLKFLRTTRFSKKNQDKISLTIKTQKNYNKSIAKRSSKKNQDKIKSNIKMQKIDKRVSRSVSDDPSFDGLNEVAGALSKTKKNRNMGNLRNIHLGLKANTKINTLNVETSENKDYCDDSQSICRKTIKGKSDIMTATKNLTTKISQKITKPGNENFVKSIYYDEKSDKSYKANTKACIKNASPLNGRASKININWTNSKTNKNIKDISKNGTYKIVQLSTDSKGSEIEDNLCSSILEQCDKTFDENPDLIKQDMLQTEKNLSSNINKLPIKTKRNINSEKLPARNRKNITTVKLDSLPNVLSQNYDQCVTGTSKKLAGNENTSCILPKTYHPPVNCDISKTCESVENVATQLAVDKVCANKSNLSEIKPRNSVITPKPNKDVQELEAILSSNVDIDRNLISDKCSEKNIQRLSIFQKEDLSFLFDDPRFETVIEEESSEPIPTVALAPSVTKLQQSSVLSENQPRLQAKESFKQTEYDGINKKQKCDVIKKDPSENASKLSSKQEASAKAVVKYLENRNLIKHTRNLAQSAETTVQPKYYELINTTTQPTGVLQNEKSKFITLMIYSNDPKSSSPSKVRSDDKADILGMVNKEGNPKSEGLKNSDCNRQYSLLNIPTNTSDNDANRKNFTRKQLTDDHECRTRRRKSNNSSYKEILARGVKNIQGIKTRSKNPIDKDNSKALLNNEQARPCNVAKTNTLINERKVPSPKRTSCIGANNLKSETPKDEKSTKTSSAMTISLEHSRLCSRRRELLNKDIKASEMLKANTKKNEFNKIVKTKIESNLGNLEQAITTKYQKKNMPGEKTKKNISEFKDEQGMSTRSKNLQKQASLRKERTRKEKNQEENVIVKNIVAHGSKTYSREEKLLKKDTEELSKSAQAQDSVNNVSTVKTTKRISHKRSPFREKEILLSKSSLINKTGNTRLQMCNPSSKLTLQSDDFENSIAASILKKRYVSHDQPFKIGESSIVSSTPRKSIGYEDAFKMFLESSNRWPLDQSISDFEKEIDEIDQDQRRGSRRRTKSVSNTKMHIFDDKKSPSEKMKKSVSWADGLNIIEYIKESDNDSDDSEIMHRSKHTEITLGKRKYPSNKKSLRANTPRKRNKSTSCSQEDQPIIKSNFKDVEKRSKTRTLNTEKESADQNDKNENYLVTEKIGFRTSRSRESLTFRNRATRSKSCTPKQENLKAISKNRSKSCSRAKIREWRLVVLLERNKQIDKMCQSLINHTAVSLRYRNKTRVGYKELLHRASSSKKI